MSSLAKRVPREDFSGIRVWAITRASGISNRRNFISGNEYKEAVERRGFALVEASKIGRDNGDCSWIDIVNATDRRTLFSRKYQVIHFRLEKPFAFSRRLLEIKRKKKRRGERKKETKTWISHLRTKTEDGHCCDCRIWSTCKGWTPSCRAVQFCNECTGEKNNWHKYSSNFFNLSS